MTAEALPVADPVCENCPATESRCALRAPLGCCENCTHTFGEDGDDPRDVGPPAATDPPLSPAPAESESGVLARGAASTSERIRKLTARAERAIADVAEALEADAGKEEIRRRVKQLEADLAAAKAELRGRPTSTTSTRSSSTSAREPCPKGCGRLLVPQGRSRHIASCKGPAS